MTPKNRIKAQLDQLQRSGAITYWQLQSGMPGLRWSVSIGGKATIAYSTNEIEAFIVGATAGARAEFSLDDVRV